MIPALEARGNTVPETWDAALIKLWKEGMMIRTQYDYEPNTKIWNPPSKDCSMRMIVQNSTAEPRLHICLEGGPEQLGDYETEVVMGLKDDWVKKTPRDTKWTYTYSGRLRSYGNRMNFASALEERKQTSWTHLAYARPTGYYTGTDYYGEPYGFTEHINYDPIEPFDQIEFIVQQITEHPYTRRAVATTGFPPGDAKTEDPPCLRQVWARGYYEDGCLKIDMHTHWRSRDAWGAALFNMYALTQLHDDICNRVQTALVEKHSKLIHDMRMFIKREDAVCPVCSDPLTINGGYANKIGCYDLFCENCQLHPFLVKTGAYLDESDSFHVYGIDMKDFEERFVRGVHGLNPETGEQERDPMPLERRYIDLTEDPWAQMLEDGREKAINRREKE